MSDSKLGTQSVYPTGNQSEFHANPGITYRQLLACHIAGHITGSLADSSESGEEFFDAYGKTVWALADAVLEVEEKE